MLERIFLELPTLETLVTVAAQFPTLVLERGAAPAGVATVDDAVLLGDGARGWQLARALDDARAVALAARAPALAVLTRLQRLVDRRNRASAGAAFDAALSRHRALHDLDKPLVRADYDHARDVWQWTLRLDGDAPLPVQLAALFHDVERLASEADARVEQHAADYDAFKARHAARGAERLRAILAALPLDAATCERAVALVAVHERPGEAARALADDAQLVADADALSFFSLNSGGYLDYFGETRTRMKIAWTLARLSARGRAQLDTVALRPDVRALMPRSDR